MIKWVRKSLGRKAVVFVVIFVLLMSLGIFQMLFYASARGYVTADRIKNESLSHHLIKLLDQDELDYLCETGERFYLSHDDLYKEFNDDPDRLKEEFAPICDEKEFKAIHKKLTDLYDELGTDIIRFGVVDYEKGIIFTFFMVSFMDEDIPDALWVARIEPFQPSDEEDATGDYEYFPENDSMYGRLSSVPYRIKIDEDNGVGVYLLMDTCLILGKLIAQFEILKTIIIMVIITVILGLLILLLVNRTVVHPLNSLSEATRELIQNLSDEENHVHVYDKVKITTGDEIEHLYNSVNAMEDGIYTYMDQLKEATAEKERLGTELDIAKGIQAHMLPSPAPDFTDQRCFDLAASMHPAKEVAGDFYDFFMLSEEKLAFLIADVSGKGIPAALVMAIGKTMLKNFTLETGSISETFRIVNNLLLENNTDNMFITVFEGILNLRTGELLYANAGHEDPVIMKAGGRFVLKKEKHSLVLGAMEDMKYKVRSMNLEPGDRIYIYTDGVPEAQDADNNMFGLDRTCETLNTVRGKTAAEVIEAVRESVNAYVEEAPQFDDMTMLLLDFRQYMSEKKSETGGKDGLQNRT